MPDSHPSDSPHIRSRRGAQGATDRFHDVTFPLAVRGYDRRAVDEFVSEVRDLVAELESRQTREAVVQRALDELGEETAGILQRAHETADEIAARSRAQAEGRMQRAEREAEIMRREANAYAEQVVVDTRLLWEERQRLIEELRQLADEVLATADDALERVKMPEGLREDEEPTTAEASIAALGPRRGDAPFEDGAGAEALPPEHDVPEQDSAFAGRTVELEALPGGAADDRAAEGEGPPAPVQP